MQIYSWNINDSNKTLEKVFTYIQKLEFDILCLQEVPQDFLGRLQALPYECVYHIDFQRLLPNETKSNYLVILTPHRIRADGRFFISQAFKQPWRTKRFVHYMKSIRAFGWSDIDNYGGVWADIQMPDAVSSMRVFSVHLRCNGPTERRREFEIVSKYLNDETINIICGDFNIVDSPWLKPFNWIMGSMIKEGMPWYPERTLSEKLFTSLSFKNPLKGKKTHVTFSNQLDHILVPDQMVVSEASVLPNLLGSDHYPIKVRGTLQSKNTSRPG